MPRPWSLLAARVIKMSTMIRVLIALCGLLVAATSQLRAETWPSKPVRLVVPFSAGGSADTLGRIFARVLSESLGQQVYVENRPGAGGVTASAQVARSEPDGYTLVVSGVASHAIAPALNANTGYDPVRDFTHIAYLGGPPIVWVVHPSLNVRTLDDLLNHIRKQFDSRQLRDRRRRHAGTSHRRLSGAQARAVDAARPLQGSGSGDVRSRGRPRQNGLDDLDHGAEPYSVGRCDADRRDRRASGFPIILTFRHSRNWAYPELVATTWFSISGPQGMPKGHRRKIESAISRKRSIIPRCAIACGRRGSASSPWTRMHFHGSSRPKWRAGLPSSNRRRQNPSRRHTSMMTFPSRTTAG